MGARTRLQVVTRPHTTPHAQHARLLPLGVLWIAPCPGWWQGRGGVVALLGGGTRATGWGEDDHGDDGGGGAGGAGGGGGGAGGAA